MAEDYDKENAIIREKLAYPSTGGSNLHSKLISRLTARRRLSERSMNKRYDSWNQVDEHCRMFIDLSRSVKKGDGTLETNKKEIPWVRSIVVPLTYAILQVQMTQLMGIFTRRDPPLEIQGVGPEDVKPAKLMNAVIAYDQVQTNFTLELYTAIMDAKKYGMGGFHDCWEEEFGYKTKRASGMTLKILNMLGLPTSQTRWDKLRQYNKVEAFDPFSTYPDARLSLSKLQNGEFFFTTLWRGYLEILANSIENGGNYFNVEAIPRTTPRNRALRSRNRFQSQQMNLIGSMDERDKGFHAIDSGVVSIIPSEWELGDDDRPEKWQFTWVDDTVIIRAHPADYDHEQFNFSAIESNIDTHVFGNPGSSENMDGLQRFMSWKYNCVDSLTEILTKRGWCFFKDLTDFDEVATVSADEDRKMWFERPKEKFAYDHDGEMIQIGGGAAVVDCLITPNHRMWISRRADLGMRRVVNGQHVRVYDEWKWSPYDFVVADDLKSGDKIPSTISWDGGQNSGELVFDEHELVRPDKCPVEKRRYPRTVFSFEQLAPLIGWYVSEGSVSRTAISIKQKKQPQVAIIDALMTLLSRHVCRYHDRKKDAYAWTLSDRRIAAWFSEHCGKGARNKKLPAIVSQFNVRLLKKLLNAAIDGDGHRVNENLATYTSTSKQLVDDLQIAAMKVGWGTSVKQRKDKRGWDLHLNFTRDGRECRKLERVPYKGKVYCVENSTHLLVIRRNGHVAITGNSHVQNLMRHLNNRMIYSSRFVESFDVNNPDAAMHIRLTAMGEEALLEGRLKMGDMIKQLELADVTSPMLKEMAFDMDLAMRMSGAADQMMGRTTSEKRTLGEITRVGHEGSARQAMDAMMIDVQGLRPLALRWCSNRQQYTEDEMFLRIAGKTAEEFGNDVKNGRILVKPGDLAGNYDYIPKTGPEPMDPGQMADVMFGGLESIMKQPQILMIPDKNGKLLDPHEFIKEGLRDKGVKNPEDFYKIMGGQAGQNPPAPNVKVVTDEEAQKQARAGNIIPIDEGRRVA